MVERPGQRQSISAASGVNARSGFWFQIYQGALNTELFVELLKHMMHQRKKSVHLIVDGLPAHKKALVREYVEFTHGRLTLHFLPDYAPDLNPDELVWSHVKRTGTARRPLHAGEHLSQRIDAELAAVQRNPKLGRSFFQAPSVDYIYYGLLSKEVADTTAERMRAEENSARLQANNDALKTELVLVRKQNMDLDAMLRDGGTKLAVTETELRTLRAACRPK